MALQFKRGTDAVRQTLVLAQGEPFFVTDYATIGTVPLFIGDGVTFGGVPALELDNLHELFDVTITQPANNQVLQWDSADGRWENRSNVVIPGTLAVNGSTTIGDASTDVLTINPDLILAPNTITVSTVDTAYNSVTATQFISHFVTATTSYNNFQTGNNTQVLGNNMQVFATGTPIKLSSTTGLTGVNTTTTYYVFDSTTSAFKIASSAANAQSGSGITTSGTYTGGTATATVYPDTGVGVALGFATNNNQAIPKSAGLIKAVSTDITNNTEDYDFILTLRKNGTLTDVMTLTSAGELKLNGVNIINSAGTVVAPAVNTGSGTFTGLTVNGAAGITGALTVGGNATISGDATITGNLTVNGTTTNIDTVNLVVEDNIILLNKNQTGTPSTSLTSGIEVERGDQTNAQWIWSEEFDRWQPSGANAYVWAQEVQGFDKIATNGGEIQFNVDNENVDSSFTANLRVKRGQGNLGGQPDAFIRWNESLDRWQFNDGVTTASLPNQSLDTTSSPTFAGLTANGTITVNNGDVILTNGNIDVDDNLTVRGSSFLGNEILIDTTEVTGIFNVNSGKLYVKPDGLIGVNRIDPAYQLDVNGTVRATDLRTSNGQIFFNTAATPSISLTATTVGIPSAVSFTAEGTLTTNGIATFNNNVNINGSTTIGNNSADDVAVNALLTTDLQFKNTTNTTRGVRGTVGDNDTWFVGAFAATANNGQLIIATADDKNEPILVRQYQGALFGAGATNELALLDASGNTSIPNTLTVDGGTLYVDSVNNRVGVNTTTPGTDLQVAGNIWANSIVAINGDLATNGDNIYFNYDNAGAGADSYLTVRRGSNANVSVRWLESTDRWQTTTDGTNYLNIPNQNLDTDSSVEFGQVAIDGIATVNTTTTTTTTTSATAISASIRVSQKTVIKVVDNVTSEMHMLEALAFRKGTTAYLTTYAEMYTNTALATFTADVSGGATRILATPTSTNSTTFTVVRIALD